MLEYKIIHGLPSDMQKTLNQWKHQYQLHIISMIVDLNNHDQVIILLTRTAL